MEVEKIIVKKDSNKVEVVFDNKLYTANAYRDFFKSIGHKVSSQWIRTLCDKKEIKTVEIVAGNDKILHAIINNFENFQRTKGIGEYDGRGMTKKKKNYAKKKI